MKILINTANLHCGGGVQVAASFISELATLLSQGYLEQLVSFDLICSNTVYKNLDPSLDISNFGTVNIVDIKGWRRPNRSTIKLFSGYDNCFTLFGPLYFKPKCKKHICGFAQAWISYPNNLAFKQLSFLHKIRSYIKFEIQWQFFKRSDFLIVEQEHVKIALIKNRSYPSSKVGIANNCISSVFLDDAKDRIFFRRENIKLGFLGRAYTHKNLGILKNVSSILKSEYGVDHQIILTLDDNEMKGLGFDDIKEFKSVGPLKVSECPDFYHKIDALIFPSLLECFSATPIEAMAMRVPVIASNLPFVRDTCNQFAIYFDPLDPQSIATSITTTFGDLSETKSRVELAYNYVVSMPNSTDRAKKYIDYITQN